MFKFCVIAILLLISFILYRINENLCILAELIKRLKGK